MIKLKRVYEKPENEDGIRVLVERLWPRGVTKQKARVEHWLKEIAPTHQLRKWYKHDIEKWPEFKERYKAELQEKPELIDKLTSLEEKNTLTLVYSARDAEHNSALVLKEVLVGK